MRRFLSSAVLLVAGSCVAIGLAEGLVRIFAPHSRDQVMPAGLFAIDSELGWKLHPGKEGRHRTRYFDVRYSINSMGFRDRPRSAGSANGKRRVLFFGDSQIFGWGVASDQHMSAVVEAPSPSMEVWNMAVPGYGLDQQILSYERDGRSLGATDVILYVSTYTLGRMRDGFLFRKQKPRFIVDSAGELVKVPVRKNLSTWTDVVYRILSPLYLPYFVDAQVKRLRPRDAMRARRRDPATPVSPEIVRLEKALLLKARAIAAERNQRLFVLASLPDVSMRDLKDFCVRNGIVLVETPWAVTPPHLVFGGHDGHWNSRGHRFVAARLRAQLGDQVTLRDSITRGTASAATKQPE